MNGSIYPERPHCACGGKFIKQTFRGQDYWFCDQDEKHEPHAYRIRKSIPDLATGKGKVVDVRYSKDGKRISTLSQAHSTRDSINADIRSGEFEPLKYRLKGNEEEYSFKWLIETQYLPHYELLCKDGKVKPSTLKAKRQYIRNYLLPFFSGVKSEKRQKKRITRAVLRGKGKRPDEYHEVPVKWASDVRSILKIRKITVTQLNASMPCSQALRDLVLQELKVILHWAKSELEIEQLIIPGFPAPKKKRLMDPETFLNEEENRKVFKHIKNDQYRIMTHLCWFYAMRPCEVRALKWSDIDWKNEVIKIQRHVTLNCTVVNGRKSQDDECHYLPLEQEVKVLLQGLARPLKTDAYMFPGEVTEIVPDNRLRKVWREALKRAGLPHVDMYRGTKSSRLSQLLANGWSMEEIQSLTGHTTLGMLAFYAQLTKRQKVERVRLKLRAVAE